MEYIAKQENQIYAEAKKIIDSINTKELPSLGVCGLCSMLSERLATAVPYYLISDMGSCFAPYIANGKWTEQRMNFLVLLSLLNADDFV